MTRTLIFNISRLILRPNQVIRLRNGAPLMDDFLKKRLKGFVFRINRSYESVLEDSFLNTLMEDACRYAIQKRRGKSPGRNRALPNGLPVYVKFWRPRRIDHRIKTIWRPSRIEVEGSQYLQFIENKLPVPDILFWGIKRTPSFKFGIYKAGMVVTRQIDHGENLAALSAQEKPPWTVHNHSNRLEVLEKVARLLHAVHQKNLIHGDYMLKNIVFTPEGPNGKYWIIDLGSVWSLPSYPSLTTIDRNRDLHRMVYSLARCGFSRNDALYFLESYLRCDKDKALSHDLAGKYLDECLNQSGHRAVEAKGLFAQNSRAEGCLSAYSQGGMET